MTGVAGEPELGGRKAVDNEPTNSFELVWAGGAALDELNLRPAEIRPLLTALMDAI